MNNKRNKLKRLHIFVGLPRAGKSTLARELGFPVVEGDALRTVIHGTPYKLNMEPMVTAMKHLMVDALFEAGHHDVIVDGCHQTREQRAQWARDGMIPIYHFLSTSPKDCCERAFDTDQDYLIPVIRQMWDEFEEFTLEESLNLYIGG